MKIKNLRVYGLGESCIRSGYPMQTREPSDLDDIGSGNGYGYEIGWDCEYLPYQTVTKFATGYTVE